MLGALAAHAETPAPAAPPYADDPAIVGMLKTLGEGESLRLPPVKHMLNGQPINGEGSSGPFARDYTTKMVYAPDRRTALYAGGNHGSGRKNDVWEYHLGSNTWHCLFPAEGGDQARFKWSLMFAARILDKSPDYKMKPEEQKNWDECKAWWKETVLFTNGLYLTRHGGPLLSGHTWDTLLYEPNTRRVIHGTGAYCAASVWLEHMFSGTPIAELEARAGKDPDGKPYRTMWFFDPAACRWQCYASESPLAVLQGMGGSMLYVPALKKVLWYYAGQNTPGAAHTMRTWDPLTDTWQEIRPNGGKSIDEVALKLKAAPVSEQQMAYSAKHRRIVAVLKNDTFAYDVDRNEWTNRNAAVPFPATDADTVFAYDDTADAFLLADPRNGKLAAYDPVANQWSLVTPKGPGIPKPPYCVGKGYYDPTHNVFVVQSAYTPSMWVYRHKQAPAAP
jgi:hypothetical protein